MATGRARLPILVPEDLTRLKQFLTLKLSEIDSSLATVFQGTGTPESAIVAPVGSVYLRTNGGAASTLYVKESGTGSTGWVAMAGPPSVPTISRTAAFGVM